MSETHSIPLDEAAVCLDDKIIFSVRNLVCPKCGAENGWYLLQRVERHGRDEEKAGQA